jgi:acyl carrier protein
VNDEAILERLRAVARDAVGVDAPLAPATDLVADLALDSVKQLELVVAVENEFAICLDGDDEAGLATVGDLVALIARRIAEDPARA